MSIIGQVERDTLTGVETATARCLAPNLINDVLLDYLRLQTVDDQTHVLLPQVFSDWIRIKRELRDTNRIHGTFFNPLQSISISEPTHSALIGDLLNPEGTHGQGRLFLQSFLSFIGVPEPAAGKWTITVERGRIDILLRRHVPPGVVIIENKSNGAVDQKNQLYRYWHRFIHLRHPDLNKKPESFRNSFKIIYMTPRASKEPVGDSLERPRELAFSANLPESVPKELLHIVTFHEILSHWTDEKLEISESNVRLKAFLHFYSELWEQS